MKTKIILILFAVIFFSCIKIINIDLKDNEKKIVMQSILMPDSTIKVNLSKSLGLLEGADTIFFLKDAEVKLYEDDIFVENLKYTQLGDYIGSIILNKNKKYKIVAKHTSIKEEASADVVFVEQVPIKNLSYETEFQEITEPLFDENGNYIKDTTYNALNSLIIKVLIDDPKDIDNFYLLSISSKEPKIIYNEQTLQYDTIGYFDKPIEYMVKGIETDPQANSGFNDANRIVLPSINLINNVYGKVFSDLWFKNSSYTINAKFFVYFDYFQSSKPLSYTYKVSLYSVPKDVFYLANSLSKYYSAHGSPFSEPVNVYSNVKGGFGFVSSLCASIDSIVIVP